MPNNDNNSPQPQPFELIKLNELWSQIGSLCTDVNINVNSRLTALQNRMAASLSESANSNYSPLTHTTQNISHETRHKTRDENRDQIEYRVPQNQENQDWNWDDIYERIEKTLPELSKLNQARLVTNGIISLEKIFDSRHREIAAAASLTLTALGALYYSYKFISDVIEICESISEEDNSSEILQKVRLETLGNAVWAITLILSTATIIPVIPTAVGTVGFVLDTIDSINHSSKLAEQQLHQNTKIDDLETKINDVHIQNNNRPQLEFFRNYEISKLALSKAQYDHAQTDSITGAINVGIAALQLATFALSTSTIVPLVITSIILTVRIGFVYKRYWEELPKEQFLQKKIDQYETIINSNEFNNLSFSNNSSNNSSKDSESHSKKNKISHFDHTFLSSSELKKIEGKKEKEASCTAQDKQEKGIISQLN